MPTQECQGTTTTYFRPQPMRSQLASQPANEELALFVNIFFLEICPYIFFENLSIYFLQSILQPILQPIVNQLITEPVTSPEILNPYTYLSWPKFQNSSILVSLSFVSLSVASTE